MLCCVLLRKPPRKGRFGIAIARKNDRILQLSAARVTSSRRPAHSKQMMTQAEHSMLTQTTTSDHGAKRGAIQFRINK